MLRVRAFPFHQDVPDFIADHDFVFVVEQNRDGQLRSLIINECGIDPMRVVPILHYDGTPITARFIARAISRASRRAEGHAAAQGGVVSLQLVTPEGGGRPAKPGGVPHRRPFHPTARSRAPP